MISTKKIQDPDKAGDFLVINAADFDPKVHKEFVSEDGDEEPAKPLDIGLVTPATLVGDGTEVVAPREPHPEGLVPPAENGRPVPPKEKIGPVVGMTGGQVVRASTTGGTAKRVATKLATQPVREAQAEEKA